MPTERPGGRTPPSKALEALAEVVGVIDCAERTTQRWRPSERQKIEAAKRSIDSRFQRNWTIQRPAREVGFDEKKLKDGFREIVGRPVHAYLRTRRLDVAAEFLLAGHNVTRAALSVGWGSFSHFSKVF